MFGKGDTIVYGHQGVFLIEDIITQSFDGIMADYFVLKSSFDDKTVIYVPCSNEKLLAKMRKLLSAEEINALITALPREEDIWVENEVERREKYRDIISSGDRFMMLLLIRSLHLHRIRCQQCGRKMHQSDEKFFKDAERLIYNEFSFVLGIDKKEVVPYIIGMIEGKA